MNKIIVNFPINKTIAVATDYLWQYDYGQILHIEGLELPSVYEAQFCNENDKNTLTMLGNEKEVLIPDELLKKEGNIICYIFLHTGAEDGETEYKIIIPVNSRQYPSDIQPTPQQESVIDQLVTLFEEGIETVQEGVETVQKEVESINDSLEQIQKNKEDIEELQYWRDNFLVISD